MPSTLSLVDQLVTDNPSLSFVPGDDFRWSPDENTIYFDPTQNDEASLLHELSHALLDHRTYSRDITLLAIERDAWNHAVTVSAPRYNVTISSDTVEESLDTYRDWLHARSTCPECKATGIQSQPHTYRCLACHAVWRVNDARTCALRRYRQK